MTGTEQIQGLLVFVLKMFTNFMKDSFVTFEYSIKHTVYFFIFFLSGKCLHLSELIPEPMTAYDDSKLLKHGIGFTNIVHRTTRGSGDLTKYFFFLSFDCILVLSAFESKISVSVLTPTDYTITPPFCNN